MQAHFSSAQNAEFILSPSKGCERVFPLHSKRFAVSALETIDGPTLKAQLVDCELIRHSKRSVLSVNERVARSGLGRFAAFGPPTRNSMINRHVELCSTCQFECATLARAARSAVRASRRNHASISRGWGRPHPSMAASQTARAESQRRPAPWVKGDGWADTWRKFPYPAPLVRPESQS